MTAAVQPRVELTPDTRVLEGGRLLLGGSPLTALRLGRAYGADTISPAARARLLDTGIAVPVLDEVPAVGVDDVTVVVPVRDRPDDLRRCLAALAPLGVIVVDDASRTPVPGALRLETNLGPAGARNAGLAEVTTPYVAFVDSDVVITGAELLSLTRHLADPGVALVAPRVRGLARGARWWERYDEAFSALDLGDRSGPVRPGSRVGHLPAACLVGRTETLRPGFDADLRVGEDVDLVWRLVEDGHRVQYDASVRALHRTRGTLIKWVTQPFGYGTSAAPLATRHGRAVAPAVLTPAYAILAVGVLARSRWAPAVALLAAGHTTNQLRRTLPLPEAARVAALGTIAAVQQASSLAVRHWWPGAVAASFVSPTVRRMLLTALAVDTAAALTDRRELGLLTRIAGRRTTDLAYGAGVWWGVLRGGSVTALLPRRPGSRRTPSSDVS